MTEQYVYLGAYFHRTTNLPIPGITEKKIGFTKDPAERQKQLNDTKMSIGYEYIALWQVDDMQKVENMLHAILDHDNLNEGEWFADDNEDLLRRVAKFMTYYGGTEIMIDTTQELPPPIPTGATGVEKLGSHFPTFFTAITEKVLAAGLEFATPTSGACTNIRKPGGKNLFSIWPQTGNKKIYIDTTEIVRSTDIFEGWIEKSVRSKSKYVYSQRFDDVDVDKIDAILDLVEMHPKA